MSRLADLIEYPWITEKSSILQQGGKYIFRVRREATKNLVKQFVEGNFNVHVIKVNSMNISGKSKRVRLQPGYTNDWKKVIVTLKAGEKIDLT
ncbi:MAG: 50S ribosomal protein L23 [Candidatus Omnitrophica bacterium]|nr:50S ribosomal protein L23 [Candidatus Omnitrophota bacterium]